MARSRTTEQQSLLAKRGTKKCELIQIDFDSAPLRLTTAGRGVTHGGNVWLGDGTLLSVGETSESLQMDAADFQIEMSGINPAMVALALNGRGKGRRVRMWVAPFNADGQIEGDPILEEDVRIDMMPVTDAVQGG